MIRFVVYDSESEVIKNVLFQDSDTSIQIGDLSKKLYGEVLTNIELLQKLSSSSLSLFVDISFEGDSVDTLDEYIKDFSYELNVTPYRSLGSQNTYRLQFHSFDFDDEEVTSLLMLDPVKEILEKDQEFSKLVNQIKVVEADWNILLNYLTRVYGFEFKVIKYYGNDPKED